MRCLFGMRRVAVTVVILSVTQSAFAANVSDVQGKVQISRAGGPFTAVNGPVVCNSGDVVRAVDNGSSAQVVSSNGSIQTAVPGAPVTCRTGVPAGVQSNPATTAATASAAAGGGVSTTAVIAGGAAIAAGVAGALVLTKKNSASP
jgi:hypothetical protein